jgi:AraC family transcriptional regulator of adaptative response/methylated-DNA-[protein]-cysteine methyltransferase
MLNCAKKQLKRGDSVIEAQLSNEYESDSSFREIFSSIIGKAPPLGKPCHILKSAWLDTKLGCMIAISDEKLLYLLEFVDCKGLEREVERLRLSTESVIISGETSPIDSIKKEIKLYFDGKLKEFKTPLFFLGSPFQKNVWKALEKIPYGQTRSYADISKVIEKPSAFRAVARANGANQIAIVIPCHRVINTGGNLGGYAGGLLRKQWLINHEKTYLS